MAAFAAAGRVGAAEDAKADEAADAVADAAAVAEDASGASVSGATSGGQEAIAVSIVEASVEAFDVPESWKSSEPFDVAAASEVGDSSDILCVAREVLLLNISLLHNCHARTIAKLVL